MERFQNILINFLFFTFCLTLLLNAQQIAFPSAEGFGAHTSGGRGGAVYEVVNLNDSGPGSLRDAVSSSNRTIVFRLSGYIDLQSTLKINGNSLTIAGQTAPGDGICVRNYPTDVNGNNIIIRYMRFRLGDKYDLSSDAININDQHDVIIDHCSMGWGVDECASWYGNDNVTIQWCIIGEGLNYKGHSMGGLWGGRSTYHHNLIHTCGSRHPKFAYTYDEDITDHRNNVIYNWGYQSAYCSTQGRVNIVGNYYKSGPATSSNVKDRIVYSEYDTKRLYVADNYVNGFPDVTADNWNGGVDGVPIRHEDAFAAPAIAYQTAENAYESVLEHAGASLLRDSVDLRVINNVINGTGTIINRQSDVGGFPMLQSIDPPDDIDQDGMPDSWEEANSLNKDDPDDRNGDDDGDGFTNLEEYLNSIIGDTMWVPPPPELPPDIDISYRHDYTSVLLNWITFNFENVLSVHLYQSESGDLSNPHIYTIEKDQDTFTIGSLTPEKTYYFVFSITDSNHIESFLGDTIAVAPGETFTTQAEDVSYISNLSVDSNHLGFNGSGFINFATSNSTVEFTNMPGFGGGECTLLYRYALGNSDRTGSLTVNGNTSSLTMHNTGDWANWITDSVTINLNPGYGNTIRFSATGSDFGNLDEVTIVPETLTSIEGENNSEALSQFELYQNYPNPFNPATTIMYKLAENSYVKLKVYDMVGREVAKLVDEQKKPGTYSAIFNAENLASGIYVYVLKSDDVVLMKKSILLK